MMNLSIIEQAYSGTIEKQYDQNLWLTHVLKKMGDNVTVLLIGNAPLYATKDSMQSVLTIGSVLIDQLPNYGKSLEGLMNDGVAVYVKDSDLERLNIKFDELVRGVRVIKSSQLADFIDQFEHVWFW